MGLKGVLLVRDVGDGLVLPHLHLLFVLVASHKGPQHAHGLKSEIRAGLGLRRGVIAGEKVLGNGDQGAWVNFLRSIYRNL
jgi:hypothetical protein